MSSDGAGDTQRTRIAGKNGGTLTPYNAEQARQAARRRWELVSAAARRGLAKAGEQIPDIARQGPVAVVEYLVTQHTLNAADPSARGATQSFKQVMDLAYPRPDREVSAGPAVPAGGATIALSPELARALLAELRRGSGDGGNVVEHRARQADGE